MKKGHIKRGIIIVKVLLISFYVGYRFFDNTNTQIFQTNKPISNVIEQIETKENIISFVAQAQTTDCGNGYCDGAENASTCPSDCGCNFNNICEVNRSEDYNNCTNDCTPPAEISCTDNIDNDLDGNTDCADTDCNGDIGPGGAICQSTETLCSDNQDNDGDGDIDCDDSSCSTDDICIPVCGDGIWDQNTEECDDGNLKNNDACSNTCQRESPACDINMYLGKSYHSSTLTIQSVGPQSNRIDILKLDWGDGTNTSSTIFPSISHHYTETGSYNIILELQNVRSGSRQTVCTNTIQINSIRGCTDTKALNHEPEATANDGSCIYSPFPDFTCEAFNLQTNKLIAEDGIGSGANTNEEVIFTWNHQPTQYTNIAFFDGKNTTIDSILTPYPHTYTEPGVYNTKLIVTHTNGIQYICSKNINIGKHGCTYEIADNYDPSASINNGSCIFSPGNGHAQIITDNPYLVGGSIYGQVAYSHDPNRIEITASLSQSGSVRYEFSPQLYQNGLFFIPIDYEPTESNYINPGTYTLYIKAKHFKGSTDYRIYADIHIHKPAVCGNSVIEEEEECDDGDKQSGDGCHASCKSNICGDNIVNLTVGSGSNTIIEQCDDGNIENNDGCSSLCKWEKSDISTGSSGTTGIGSHPISNIIITIPYCGNNLLEGEEECDGGKNCSTQCTKKTATAYSHQASRDEKKRELSPFLGLTFDEKKKIRKLAQEQFSSHATLQEKELAIEGYKQRIDNILESNSDHQTTLTMFTLRSYTIMLLEKEIYSQQTTGG